MPLTSAYTARGSFPGRARPLCVRIPRIPGGAQATDGGEKATDRAGGSGHADRPAQLLASELPFQAADPLSALPSSQKACSARDSRTPKLRAQSADPVTPAGQVCLYASVVAVE